MNLENPTSIISSATNAVAQITSLAAEKLGPITVKTVEVVQRQVVVEAVTLALVCAATAIICVLSLKSAHFFDAKIIDSSSCREDDVNKSYAVISWIVAAVSAAVFLGTLIACVTTVPTAIFNTEYATAEKFVEIFDEITP